MWLIVENAYAFTVINSQIVESCCRHEYFSHSLTNGFYFFCTERVRVDEFSLKIDFDYSSFADYL